MYENIRVPPPPPWVQLTTWTLINLTEGVHTWRSDCIWWVGNNIGFWSLKWPCSQRSIICQIFLKSVLCFVKRNLLSFFTEGVHIYHNHCLWCVNYKDNRSHSGLEVDGKVWSQIYLESLTAHNINSSSNFWQRCFIFCTVIANMTFKSNDKVRYKQIFRLASIANSSSSFFGKTIHIWHNDKKLFVFQVWVSSQRSRSKQLNSGSITWKTYISYVLMYVVHIVYTDCLWCVYINNGFGLLIWPLFQGQGHNT